jgi:hypothetical protein
MHFSKNWKETPKEGYESRRFGGLVWKTRVDNDLLRFVNNAGTTCRQELVRSCYLMLTFEIGTFSTRVRIPKNSNECATARLSGGQVDPKDRME